MNRRFFICSVGEIGQDYAKDNLQRCREYKGHFMHRDTKHKGVFDQVKKDDIIFLKFNDRLIAYGNVKSIDTTDKEELAGWNYAIYVDELFFFDYSNFEKGVSNYGVKDASIGTDQYATIKEIKTSFALKKLEEINKNNHLFIEIKMEDKRQKIKELLISTHNLILTGAPGTGKTYLAKEIAQQMIFGEIKTQMTEEERKQFNEQCGFVQFHPSYDYTDFVEGLRPIQDDNGNVGFERKDGVFKAFCAKALENYVDSRKQENDIKEDEIFENVYNSLYNDIDEGEISEYPTKKGLLPVFISQKKNQIVFKTKTDDKKSVKKEYLKALFNNLKDDNVDIINITKERLDERVSKVTEIEHVDHIQYRWTLDQLVSRYKKLKKETLVAKVIKQKDFVFIIDEINRGEISKIFGELFFSIDPGYRGEKGRVQTQYQNIVEDGDIFKKGFFVPENVYIIGTMNDIDRSVESMDFAFRRRFAFKEVSAEESQNMLDREDAWGKDKAGNSLKPKDKIIQKEDGGNG